MILEFRSQGLLTGRTPLFRVRVRSVDLTPGAFADRRVCEADTGNANIPLARQPLLCEFVVVPAQPHSNSLRESYLKRIRVVKDCEVSIRWVNLLQMACV
jgi:hypothetical protein